MRIFSFSAIALTLLCCQVAAAQSAQGPLPSAGTAVGSDQFEIHTDEWVSLHFFAFHAARALSGEDYGFRTVPLFPEDAALLDDPAIAAAFEPMAELYRPVLKNSLFRGALFRIARQLGEGPETIESADVRSAFEAFMPTYQEHFWPRHKAVAEAFAAELRAELAVHGQALLAATANELDATWGDAGYLTYITAYANWAGAFSNDNILFMSAADPDVVAHKLEIYVHEAAHGEPIGNTIRPAADSALAAHDMENNRFWHYLQFKATGEAAKQVLGDDYVPYVRATGLAGRSTMKIWYDALDTAWQQHNTLEDRAMAAVATVAAERK